MAAAPQHTFQVLTKRPGRMASVLDQLQPEPLPNVWWGTSVELDEYVWRADRLRETPAAVRFLSLEPLLGPLPSLDLAGIDWVIVGGESGTQSKDHRAPMPMKPEWVRPIRDRCAEQGVAFFFKQTGTVWAKELGALRARARARTSSRPSSWCGSTRRRWRWSHSGRGPGDASRHGAGDVLLEH